MPRLLEVAVVANLVAQVGIVVTGGLVRLTGSGLGCPTWPQCVPGSYTPTSEQQLGLLPYIEFGNRLLTFVVGAAAVATLLLVLRHRRRLWPWGAAPLVGTALQAVLGGITVLTDLHPATVAAHFVLSAVLVAVSTVLLLRIGEPDVPAVAVVSRPVRGLTLGVAAVGALTILLGTVVTGSGPHSGDVEAPVRFDLDFETVARAHAESVLLFVGLLVGLLVCLHATATPAVLRRRGAVLLAVTLAQGGLGYLQYFSGLPRPLVNLHMLGACLLVVALTWLVCGTRQRVRAGAPARRNLRGSSAPAQLVGS